MTDATQEKKIPDHVDRFKDKPVEPIIEIGRAHVRTPVTS